MPSFLDSIHSYVAPLLILAGLGWSFTGMHHSRSALRLPPGAAAKNLKLMRGFRVAIVGLAIALAAAGWLIGSIGLVAIAAVIGIGELMETSLDAWALRREVEYRATGRWTPPLSRP